MTCCKCAFSFVSSALLIFFLWHRSTWLVQQPLSLDMHSRGSEHHSTICVSRWISRLGRDIFNISGVWAFNITQDFNPWYYNFFFSCSFSFLVLYIYGLFGYETMSEKLYIRVEVSSLATASAKFRMSASGTGRQDSCVIAFEGDASLSILDRWLASRLSTATW